MVPDQQRLSLEERANLVAYLDGELNEVQAQAIATKLTQSLTARREVDALQKTWELLDLLPRPLASEDFAARTLTEMTRLGEDRISSAANVLLRRARIALAVTACAATLFILGYVLTSRIWPDPTARLSRDLPIAEALDEYRDAESFDFLKLLDSSTDF